MINSNFLNVGLRLQEDVLVPPMYLEDLRRNKVKLVANKTYRKGQVLGEITATAATAAGTITLAGSSGTFALGLTIGGQTEYTAYIPYNATPAQVQAALVATNAIGPGGITIGGSGTALTYTYAGPLVGQPQPVFLIDNSRMVGGSVATAQTTAGVANGSFDVYSDGASNGTQVAKCVLDRAYVTDARGWASMGLVAASYPFASAEPTATAIIKGYLNTQDLVGLDAAGVVDLGRIIRGDLTNGVISLL